MGDYYPPVSQEGNRECHLQYGDDEEPHKGHLEALATRHIGGHDHEGRRHDQGRYEQHLVHPACEGVVHDKFGLIVEPLVFESGRGTGNVPGMFLSARSSEEGLK